MTISSIDQLALHGDRSLGGLALALSRSYQSDSEADLYIPYETFNYRRPSSNTTLRLQDPSLKCDRNLGWNIDWAVALIVDRLETKLTDAAEKFRNIRIRAATLEREGLIQEIPYRIFNKLDEVLFGGYLRNAVFLDVNTLSSLSSDVSGATYTHSWGPNTEVKRISIILNSNALQYARARDVVAILIHHMIHAYFLVACGPQKEEEVDYGRLGHGVHFGKIMLAIKKLSAVHGKELTPLNFGHSSAANRYFADEYYYPRRRAVIEREDKEKWYCSHCHCDVEVISESEIDAWYDRVCKPMFDQPKSIRTAEVAIYNDRRHEIETRRRAETSAKSVEFLFKKAPILVDSTKVDLLLSVRRVFDQANSRFLEVHKDVPEQTFLRFLEFLHTGSYRPDLASFAAAAAGLGAARNGPPVIKPRSSTTEAPLLADIQFAKLSTLMGFDECKAYALGRMNAYGVSYEDPVAVLQEIYHGREPDPDLKNWARKFLIQAPATLSSDHHSAFLTLGTMEPPNLIKLESEQGSYRARFLDAIDSSGALENDVNKARTELKAAGWYSWSLPHASPSLGLPSRYSPNTFSLGLARPSPLFLGAAGPSSTGRTWLGASGIAADLQGLPSSFTGLSAFELERMRELEREQLRDLEREKLRNMERVKIQELERGRLRDLERERDRIKETKAQVQAAAALERFYTSGLGGFVLDDERY